MAATSPVSSNNWQQYMNQGFYNPMYQGFNQAQAAVAGESNLQQQEAGMIDQYQNQSAPTMEAAQLGAAPTMKAAQLGNVTNAQGSSMGQVDLQRTNIDQTNDDQDRGRQQAFLSQLQQQANGQGPSVAALQAQQAANQATSQMQGTLGSQMGSSNSALNLRMAADQAQQNQQNAASTAAMGRTQEQLNAQGQLGAVQNNMRAADQGMATNQANLAQQANMTQAQLAQQANMTNAQLAQANSQYNAGNANQFALSQAQMQQQANAANQGMAGQYGLQQGQFNQGANANNQNAQLQQTSMNNGMVGGLLNGQANLYGAENSQNLQQTGMIMGNGFNQQQLRAGQNAQALSAGFQAASTTAAAFSDENLKTDIRPGDAKLKSFLDQLSAYDYEYKDPAADGEGRHVSPMAQDLLDSDVGSGMVEETPRGLLVNYGKGFGTMLAAEAMNSRRISKLEKKATK